MKCICLKKALKILNERQEEKGLSPCLPILEMQLQVAFANWILPVCAQVVKLDAYWYYFQNAADFGILTQEEALEKMELRCILE